MKDTKQKWFVNQLLDALEKAGKKKVNLDLAPRAILIAIAKHAYKSGNSYPLTSQIEDASGVSASNQNKAFKILESRKFLTIKRKFIITKEGKKMTKNTYKIHLDVILNLSINQETGEVSVNNASIKNEPSVLSTSRSRIEPSVLSTTLKPNKQKQDQKQKLLNNDYDQNSSNVLDLPVDAYFEDFWATYPRKEGKQKARAIWIRERLDSIGGEIIEDVRQRQVRHDRWEDRSFIPHPTTYLNNAQWKDEIVERRKIDGEKKGKFDSAVYLVDQVRKDYENKRGNTETVLMFQTIFLRKWTDNFSTPEILEIASVQWQKGLAGIDNEAIQRALDYAA